MKKQSKKTASTALIVVVAVIMIALVGFQLFGKNNKVDKQTVYAVLPLTGMVADPGNMAKNAMLLYMREHPDSDFKISFVDSESNASKAVAALSNAIIGEQNPIVVSFMLPITLSILPIVEASEGFVLATGTLDSPSLNIFKSYVRISHGAIDFTVPMAKYVSKHYKRMALIYANDEYGTTVKNVFKTNLDNSDVHVMGEIDYTPSSGDVRYVIEKLKKMDCEAAFITGMFSVGYQAILSEIGANDINIDIVTDISFTHPSIKSFNSHIKNTVIYPCFDAELPRPQNEASSEFKQLCLGNGLQPYFVTIETFDALNLLNQFLGNHIPLSQEAFSHLREYDGVSGKIEFDNNGNSYYSPAIAIFRNGKTEVVLDGDK